MTRSAHSPRPGRVQSPQRRSLLTLLATVSMVGPAALLTSCARAIPTREYERPESHITGRGGNSGRGGN